MVSATHPVPKEIRDAEVAIFVVKMVKQMQWLDALKECVLRCVAPVLDTVAILIKRCLPIAAATAAAAPALPPIGAPSGRVTAPIVGSVVCKAPNKTRKSLGSW